MKAINLVAAVGFLAGAAAAVAAEQKIGQKGKAFSVSEVTIKRGDTLVFVNDDNVVHNVLSASPGHQFNIGSQAPGVSTPVKFDKAGSINVLCAIHPVMKMKVNVVD